jgi:transcription antitermination factor NusG
MVPYWCVVRAQQNHERLAVESVVVRLGYELFVPRIRVRIASRWKTVGLFGSYFFCRIESQWRAIERAPGVLSLIKHGETPARCPDAEIAALLERSDPDGIIRLPSRSSVQSPRRTLAPGAHVAIAGGPLAGFEAIHTGMTTHERELVLLNVLGAQRPVAVPAHLIAPQ